MLVILIAALPINAAFASRRVLSAEPRQKMLRYARTVVVLWCVTALAAYALRLHGLDLTNIGVRGVQRAPQLALGLFSLVAPLVALLAGAPRTLKPQYAQALRAIVPENRAQWAAFVCVAATAAICEELLYRGYALTTIAAMAGSMTAAVAVSCLAFGFAHAYQGRTGIVGATISGLFYSLVFLATGSLYPCIIGHFAQDLAAAAVLARPAIASSH